MKMIFHLENVEGMKMIFSMKITKCFYLNLVQPQNIANKQLTEDTKIRKKQNHWFLWKLEKTCLV